jgi:2-methylisocitrate lyase-like PEP mutase family enzyme
MSDLLRSRPHGPSALRALLAGRRPVLAPGAYDALSARLVERAGFEAVYLTGFGAAASLLGRPDVGLLGPDEMAGQVRRFVQAVDIPVIADADTGYGSALNVVRTVQDYEQAGVAGLHLEDQVHPKRCGHLDGKQVIAREEMVGKIGAAAAARRHPDLVLIARTDARAVEGLDAAIARARAYHAAGADMLFVEAVHDAGEVATVAERLAGIPLLYNWAEGGKSPALPLGRLEELGYAVVIMPLSALLAATAAIEETLAAIRAEGTPVTVAPRLPSFGSFLERIGLPEVDATGRRFAADPTL